jgi:hypothetical protein
LREALERFVAPELATALLFEALELFGRPPPSRFEETRAFAASALAEAVCRKMGPQHASEILRSIDEVIARAADLEGVAIDIDVEAPVEDEDDDATVTTQMMVVQKPVPVVVIGATGAFAARLSACLGDDRVFAVAVGNQASLRKAVFSYAPLLVIVDGVDPPAVDPSELAAALRGLPDATLPVLWAADSPWSADFLRRLEDAGVPIVTFPRREGIEPLLDMVLARFRGKA